MKQILLIWGMLGWLWCQSAQADLPSARQLAPTMRNWKANATVATSSGFLITGEQLISATRTRMVLVHTDSTGNIRWTRAYSLLKGRVAGYSLLANDASRTFVAGSQDGLAKLWNINPTQGDIHWSLILGEGLVRSTISLSENRLCVAIEKDNHLEVQCLDYTGKLYWKREFEKDEFSKSSMHVTKKGNLILAYEGTTLALDKAGDIVWQNHTEITQWKGLYERLNGEVLVYGRRRVNVFGSESEDAFIVSVDPETSQRAWFRHFGKVETYDEANLIAERSNEQLLLVARQDQKLRLIELSQSNTLSRARFFGDSLPSFRYIAVGIVSQSAFKDQWLIVYNRSDGTVWMQPTRQTEIEISEITNLSFHLKVKGPGHQTVAPTPITEVPTTCQLGFQPGSAFSVQFTNCRGEGYAYLLSRNYPGSHWEEKGWVQLGSQDCLSLHPDSEQTQYLILVTTRPFADPLGLVLQSDAYQVTSPRPDPKVSSLAELYPATLGEELRVKVSADGTRFEIQDMRPVGWVPILVTFKKNIP